METLEVKFHTLLRLTLNKDEHISGFGWCIPEERALCTNCKFDWVHPVPGAETMVTSDILAMLTIMILFIKIINNNNNNNNDTNISYIFK